MLDIGDANGLVQTGREGDNDALDQCRQLMERFEHRLTLDNPRFVERYVESKLQLWIKFSIRGVDVKFIAHLQREENVCGFEESIYAGHVLGMGKRLWHHLGYGGPKIDALEHRPHGNQQAVFLDVVKAVEHPEWVIPTLVWF